MTTTVTENTPVEVTVHRSPLDGALVIQVDTTEETGPLRVTLNDSPIWNRDPEELPATVNEIAEDVISSRYVDMNTFRFAMAQDGPPLDDQGVMSILRQGVARGMDHREEY